MDFTCSVVICTRDRPAAVDRCLAALRIVRYHNVDVLVVDNAPRDDRTKLVAERHGARYLIEALPGLSRARNRSVSACDADIIAYLDDDAVPEKDWLETLVHEFQDPLVMAVAGQVRPLNEGYGGSFFVTGGSERLVVDKQTRSWFEIANFGGVGIGANMAFRRAAFEFWPGFDERLDSGVPLHGGGEHYAFFSLIERGYRVVYTPRAVVYHYLRETFTEARAEELRNRAAATGYMTFLVFEEPRYRFRTLKYFAEGVVGVSRKWRAPMPGVAPRIASLWSTLLAYLRGPWLYWQSRHQKQNSGRGKE